MRVFAIIAALIAVGLAGCAGESGSNNDTGFKAANGMESEALAWNPRAELVALSSIELRSDSPFMAAAIGEPALGPTFALVLGEPVADGRSSLWAAVYEAEGEELTIYWTPNKVLMTNTTADLSTGAAIDWAQIVVDSDEAADILAESDGNWSAVRSATELYGGVTLVNTGDDLVWAFFATTFEITSEFLIGGVSALTGNLTEEFSLEPEGVVGSIGLTASSSVTTTFVLENKHQGLVLNLAKSGGDPPVLGVIGPNLDVIITDPEGETYEFSVGGSDTVANLPGTAGEWKIQATSNDLLLASSLSYAGITHD